MIWSVGYRQIALEYERKPRPKGKTKFGLFRMLRFALDGITSFSMKPLRFATLAGFVTGIVGLGWALFSSLNALLRGVELTHLSVVIPLFLFFSGLQLTVAGIMGEYVGRIFEQVKGRPLYNIAETAGLDY
jgi:dolichol-phosphate mannosyltransferase